MSQRFTVLMALIYVGAVGGVAPLFMKTAYFHYLPAQLLFLRYLLAFIFFIPYIFLHRDLVFDVRLWREYTITSIFYVGNVFCFAFGIQHTTSTVSQLFYLLTPLFVSLVSFIVFKEATSLRRVVSMVFGVAGASFIIFRSASAQSLISSIGTLQGNITIILGVFCWALYILYFKKTKQPLVPYAVTSWNFFVSLCFAAVILSLSPVLLSQTITSFMQIPFGVIASILALALLNTIILIILYQWVIKRASAFAVASATYLSPLSAALFAIPFLGETLSVPLLLGAVCISIGSFILLTEKLK